MENEVTVRRIEAAADMLKAAAQLLAIGEVHLPGELIARVETEIRVAKSELK